MKILLFRGKGLVATLIKWQTRSAYTHAAVMFDTGMVVEAVQGAGVRWQMGIHPDYEMSDCDIFTVDGDETYALAFAMDQVGKPYDWTMLFRFISRQQETRKSRGHWFCSEFAFAAAMKIKTIFQFTEPWEVPPGDLARSPVLRLTAERRGGKEITLL